MIAFLFGSASSSLPEESTSLFLLVGATLPGVPGAGDKKRSWRLSQCHKDLRVLIVCYKSGSKGFIGSSRGFEGINTSGTESCLNVGWYGCCIPCFIANLAASLLGESAIEQCDIRAVCSFHCGVIHV
jgi:hypothetical protein